MEKHLDILDRLSSILYDIVGIKDVQGGTSLEFADDIDWEEIIYEMQIEFNMDISSDLRWKYVYEIIEYLLDKLP